MNNKRQ